MGKRRKEKLYPVPPFYRIREGIFPFSSMKGSFGCTVGSLSSQLQFKYICDAERWVKFCISIEMFGVLIGALTFGHLSDRFGRRRLLIFPFIFTTLFSLAASFAVDLVMFTVLRTFVGFFSGGQLV